MLYPKNAQPLTPQLFEKPTSEYRGTPFWAWNNKLDTEDLLWQIEQLKKMGFGGFHMHVRTGLATPYLSDEHMQAIQACVDKAGQEAMLAWLYDEDRWPSGAAGGLVTKNHAYRQRYLLLTRVPHGRAPQPRHEDGHLVTCFDVRLNADGSLAAYSQVDEAAEPKGFKLYAYEEVAPDNPWFNNQAYLNTLDPASVREFIKVTYERYKEKIGKAFGGVVPAMFTDEPQFFCKGTLDFAHDDKDVTLPWTPDIEETYQAAYAQSLVRHLPELLWDLPEGKPSQARYRYHDHIAERFASAFADQCGAWCQENGLMLTGHMMEEPTLESQTAALGEAMRSYRGFQLPGIDMLCDWREFTTAKQTQSAARQFGRPGVLSELYGVTNWNFDFRQHKLQGDWQAALGVTVRVPHLSWVSMNGEAKRDYPATFNYQSPWYQKYPYIEDHFARVNTAMTRGKAVCRVGVLHPVESYWLHWGARENTQAVRDHMDKQFRQLTNWLLHGLVDFDFISESLLPGQCAVEAIEKEAFPVGEMCYSVLLVPEMETIRSSTLDRLERFAQLGGRVIFMGKAPTLADACPDGRGQALHARCEKIGYDKIELCNALAPVREIEIRDSTGVETEGLLYQLREEAGARWLFIAHADKPENADIPKGELLRIKMKGDWWLTLYNTLSGETTPLAATRQDGWTCLQTPFYEHDSLLLRLDAPEAGHPAEESVPPQMVNVADEGLGCLFAKLPVTLHEPNVLLLDMPEYALDGEAWRGKEEVLRLDNRLREQLGWPKRGAAFAQPWVETDKTTPHTLRLRYTFTSRLAITGAKLGLENAAITRVTLNGVDAAPPSGWYVDKCIGTVPLPDIAEGENVLELELPYGKTIDVEACYLLGDFGVQVEGFAATLTKPVTQLAFGDITTQGLPFYGGNLTYHMDMNLEEGAYTLAATSYRGHLLQLAVDGQDVGNLVFSPYQLAAGQLKAGKHRFDLTVYGSRINTFGQLHQNDKGTEWWGPESWRSAGAGWTYEYHFWPQGVLKAPVIAKAQKP